MNSLGSHKVTKLKLVAWLFNKLPIEVIKVCGVDKYEEMQWVFE